MNIYSNKPINKQCKCCGSKFNAVPNENKIWSDPFTKELYGVLFNCSCKSTLMVKASHLVDSNVIDLDYYRNNRIIKKRA